MTRGCGGPSESISRAGGAAGLHQERPKKHERKLNMKSWKIIFTTVLSALICFGLLAGANAVGPAAPDTALPGGNTADGQSALRSLTTGQFNSAFQRVPQRAQESDGIASHRRAATERDGSFDRAAQRAGSANPERQRADWSEQTGDQGSSQ